MANALFNSYRTSTLTNPPDLSATTIKGMFVDHADDTPNTATDDMINDILGAARVPVIASCPVLTTKAYGGLGAGVFSADPLVFSALSGDTSESLILFVDTGNEATSNLLSYWDQPSGLPVVPNDASVTVVWSGSGIFTF